MEHMPGQRDAATQAALDKLLETHGLGPATMLYREAMRTALKPAGAPGLFRLAANPSPSESVVDVYGQGYLVQAESLGPGLAFAESDAPNWQETMEMRALKAKGEERTAIEAEHVEVEVALMDILQQGGLLYPVESVTVEKAWYCTLPAGEVTVRAVG
jgi:hypothetical protein